MSNKDNDQKTDDRGVIIPRTLEGVSAPDTEMRIAAIRNLIQLNSGKILKIEDFNKAAHMSFAIHHLHRLINQGRVARKQVKTGFRGQQYTYEWIDKAPYTPAVQAKNVETDEDNDVALTLDEIDELSTLWKEKASDAESESALAMKHLGVVQFIRWLKTKDKEYK